MIFRKCARCGEEKYIHANTRRRASEVYCQPCSLAVYNATRIKQLREEKLVYLANYYKDNRDKLDKYSADYREQLRLQCVAAYGGACAYCGIDDPIVLVIDHVNNDAQQDRIEQRHNGGYKLYTRLRQLGYPKDRYQLL